MTCDKTPQCPKPCGLCPERRPVPAGSESLADRLRDEADQARNDGADDIALLLDEAADALPNQPMVPLSAMRPVAVEAIRAITGCPDILGNGLSLVEELESVAKAAAALQSQPKPVPAGSEVDGERATPAATPPAGAGMVLVPVEDVAAASTALGNFVSDHGWGASDMQAMDNLDAHLAQHRARLQAAPSPAPAPAATDTAVMALREAAKQAVAALVKIKDHRLNIWDLDDDIDALNAAISAQAEPQAAAEVTPSDVCDNCGETAPGCGGLFASDGEVCKFGQPAPAPAQQLSDEQIEALLQRCGGKWNGDYWVIEDADLHPFVRAAMQQKGGAV